MSDGLPKGIDSLIKVITELKATNGHIVMANVKNKKDLTVVTSVYYNEKPAHIVLNELYEWCEKNNYTPVCDKIKDLEKDMSWNNNNDNDPV